MTITFQNEITNSRRQNKNTFDNRSIIVQYGLHCLFNISIFSLLKTISENNNNEKYFELIHESKRIYPSKNNDKFNNTKEKSDIKYVLIEFMNQSVCFHNFFYVLPDKLKIYYLIESFEKLLDSLELMTDNNITLLQLSYSNIEINESYSPVLVNLYGNIIDTSKIMDLEYFSLMKSQDSKDSVNIPYELYLLIGLSNNIPFEMIKDRYINELINRKMYSDDEIKIINDKLKTINDVDVLNIRKYNWNCYMLSMFYLEVLNDYEYLFEEEELKEFFNKWNEILKNNIDVNYLVRGSLKMTKEDFSQLIGISVWN